MDKQREAFEMYHRKHCAESLGMHPADIESEFDKDSEGNYYWGAAQCGWAIWQACAKQQEAEIELLKGLLEVAKCPCCDGSGAYYDDYGNVNQCQFCDERYHALNEQSE